jgi:hypothetical protein
MKGEGPMTWEEAMAKWGDVALTFARYYKYSFAFKGIAPDGATVTAFAGGDHNDIYRWVVVAGEEVTLRSLDPNFIAVVSPNGDKVCEIGNPSSW